MNKTDALQVLQDMLAAPPGQAHYFYDRLDALGMIEYSYGSFMITEPIDCNAELWRIGDADWALSCALLTMLFREDHFSNGAFEDRVERGDVKMIVEHMIDLIHEEM